MPDKQEEPRYTEFGRFTRTLRAEHDEYLKDMAKRIGLTPAYLSIVERGIRNAPYEWIGRIRDTYELGDWDTYCLMRAVMNSREQDLLDISHLSLDEKRMSHALVAQLPDMDEQTRTQLQQLLQVIPDDQMDEHVLAQAPEQVFNFNFYAGEPEPDA